jgi:DNA repair protein SbcD/Mre11
MSEPIRILQLGDSHLGFDLPARPRIERRRRGDDFLANYHRALAPALAGQVDLVVHGGDVFHHPRISPRVVDQAFAPLRNLADAGVPVIVVPGNHERSHIPHGLLAVHPAIHVFHQARTVELCIRGATVALAGFPYARNVRGALPGLLAAAGWHGSRADLRLLCIHHCVDGAVVGPGERGFGDQPDVIRGADLPADAAAVLSGHIHRHQVLRADSRGRPLPVPIVYAGSIERTSFAEIGETKGYVIAELEPGPAGGRLAGWRHCPLPARPLIERSVHAGGAGRRALEARVDAALGDLPDDAVVRLVVHGVLDPAAAAALAATRLRARVPPTVNISLAGRVPGRARSPRPAS